MKHDYATEVKFRRKDLRAGDTVKVLGVPDAPMTEGERSAITKAVGNEFVVIDADEHGAIIQLDYFAPTFVDVVVLQRTA